MAAGRQDLPRSRITQFCPNVVKQCPTDDDVYFRCIKYLRPTRVSRKYLALLLIMQFENVGTHLTAAITDSIGNAHPPCQTSRFHCMIASSHNLPFFP